MATAKKSKAASSPAWQRVWVLGGEPCITRLVLESTLSDLASLHTVRFERGDNPNALNAALTGYVWSEPADAVVLHDPNADLLRVSLEVIESNVLTASGLIVLTPGGQLDGRAPFAKAASAQKRLYNFPYLAVEDEGGLRKHLTGWQEDGVFLTPGALDWLLMRAPIVNVKLKGRDTEVYDLTTLENELNKVGVVAAETGNGITSGDLERYCVFARTGDVWAFIQAALGGQLGAATQRFERLQHEQDHEGLLWLLVSQITLCLEIKALQEGGVCDPEMIMRRLSLQPFLGRYLGADWQPLTDIPIAPTFNPWRVRNAMTSSTTWKASTLSIQYYAVVAAMLDLRAGGPPDVVFPYLLLALAGRAPYTIPAFAV